MATEEQPAPVTGTPAAEFQPRRAVRAGVARLRLLRPGVAHAWVLPAVLGKAVAEKIFEVFSWKPEDALFFPLGCQSRMVD